MTWKEIELIGYIAKNLLIPIITVLAVILSIIIAWKKGLLVEKKGGKDTDARRPTVIRGDANVIQISPSEMQRMAYDPNKFDEYHQQSINQSRISFWFSLIFAMIGFLIIATSIFTYSDKSGYLGIVAGTIIDAVSALFFVQSNKARQLMSDFFDKLRQDRKLEESLKLCESIDDVFLRNAVKVKLSIYFSGIEDSHNIVSEIIKIGKNMLSKSSETENS